MDTNNDQERQIEANRLALLEHAATFAKLRIAWAEQAAFIRDMKKLLQDLTVGLSRLEASSLESEHRVKARLAMHGFGEGNGKQS